MRERLRAARAPLALLIGHALALAVLSRVDVVGEILGAVRPNPLLLLIALGFFGLRVLAVFVAPAWLILALLWPRPGALKLR